MISTFDSRMQSLRSWIQHRVIESLGHDTAWLKENDDHIWHDDMGHLYVLEYKRDLV